MHDTENVLRGTIEKVYCAGPRFSAGRLRGADGKLDSFAGNLFAPGAAWGVCGASEQHWTTDYRSG
jgi:hypothetical protein